MGASSPLFIASGQSSAWVEFRRTADNTAAGAIPVTAVSILPDYLGILIVMPLQTYGSPRASTQKPVILMRRPILNHISGPKCDKRAHTKQGVVLEVAKGLVHSLVGNLEMRSGKKVE